MPRNQVDDKGAIPAQDLDKLLLESGNAVLVGGQALAFWVTYYGVHESAPPRAFITSDVDLLGVRDDANRLGRALGGTVEHPKGLSILSGIVTARTQNGDAYEIDVLRRVCGLTEHQIRKNAKTITPSASQVPYLVMAPTDCLVSRLENLRLIHAKQDDVGRWQARLAVQVNRKLVEELVVAGDEKAAVKVATRVLRMATHAMGVNAYKKHGIDVLDAIPMERFAASLFFEQQWRRSVDRILEFRKIASQNEKSSGRQPK